MPHTFGSRSEQSCSASAHVSEQCRSLDFDVPHQMLPQRETSCRCEGRIALQSLHWGALMENLVRALHLLIGQDKHCTAQWRLSSLQARSGSCCGWAHGPVRSAHESPLMAECRDSWLPLGKPQEVMGFDFYESQANMEPLQVHPISSLLSSKSMHMDHQWRRLAFTTETVKVTRATLQADQRKPASLFWAVN